eukprot:gene10743-11934_t
MTCPPTRNQVNIVSILTFQEMPLIATLIWSYLFPVDPHFLLQRARRVHPTTLELLPPTAALLQSVLVEVNHVMTCKYRDRQPYSFHLDALELFSKHIASDAAMARHVPIVTSLVRHWQNAAAAVPDEYHEPPAALFRYLQWTDMARFMNRVTGLWVEASGPVDPFASSSAWTLRLTFTTGILHWKPHGHYRRGHSQQEEDWRNGLAHHTDSFDLSLHRQHREASVAMEVLVSDAVGASVVGAREGTKSFALYLSPQEMINSPIPPFVHNMETWLPHVLPLKQALFVQPNASMTAQEMACKLTNDLILPLMKGTLRAESMPLFTLVERAPGTLLDGRSVRRDGTFVPYLIRLHCKNS